MTRYEAPSAPPRTGWDIHCHTAFSDGTETPEGLVRAARDAGLLGVGIADHDTSAGWEQAADAARRAGMPLLRGTEITACDEGISVHMLGLLYDPDDPGVVAMFARTRQARLARTRRMVDLLAKDYPIDWDSVSAQIREGDNTTVGRPHIADALVAAGVYRTRSEAFAGAVSAASPYYIPTPSPTTHEVLHTIGEAGGVVVLAHPGDPSRNRRLLTDEQIVTLADEGLDGLEVWHRGNPPDQRRRLLALADRLGLLVTGGSDWHGAGKPNLLGENLTDEATVDRIVGRGALPVV